MRGDTAEELPDDDHVHAVDPLERRGVREAREDLRGPHVDGEVTGLADSEDLSNRPYIRC